MKRLFPITPNTGGIIKLNNIVGREQTIQEYWSILDQRGISLFAERRFGKSSVLRKMNGRAPTGFKSIYKSVMGVKNIDDFVEMLYTHTKEHNLLTSTTLSEFEKKWNTLAAAIPSIAGVKLGAINQIWQKRLIALIENICNNHKGDKLVIMLDEFSLMLDGMPVDQAAAIIGFFRDIVHDRFPDKLRFIYAGSIGIDLIIQKIERQGYNLGDPLNHTEKKRLPPFDYDRAKYFCQCLELGCDMQVADENRNLIIEYSDGIPYFIDRFYDVLRKEKNLTAASVESTLNYILNDPSDANNLAHFYTRINDHYPEPELSSNILSILCRTDSISEQNITETVLQTNDYKESLIKDEINRLWRDGYFIRNIQDGQRAFTFQYSIIKNWWSINRA